MNRFTDLGIVVIGRNEGERLRRCLESLPRNGTPCVYVDSGSTDGSPELARNMGCTVIELDTALALSAARGRQVGLEHLCARCPGTKYVQFVDGDCVLQPGWIEAAVQFLENNPRTAVVVGILRERFASSSLLVRLVEADWDISEGETDAIYGISMTRVAAIREVGGWRVELIAGEELDLGARLRSRGWKLYRVAADMTLHDIGIRNAGELWRRTVRSGYAYAQLARLHGWSRCPRWLRRAMGNLLYGAIFPILFIALLFIWWPMSAGIVAMYAVLFVRVALWRLRRGDTARFALLYATFMLACKIPAAIGTFKYALDGLLRHRRGLIEYKSASSVAG